MTNKELCAAIASRYGVKGNVSLPRVINRAIRTLPGGAETLDAIEATNAALNHAERHKASERVIAIDAVIDRLEGIRDAMERCVLASVEGRGENK